MPVKKNIEKHGQELSMKNFFLSNLSKAVGSAEIIKCLDCYLSHYLSAKRIRVFKANLYLLDDVNVEMIA